MMPRTECSFEVCVQDSWALSKIYASVASDKDSNGLNLVPVTGKSQVKSHDLATNKFIIKNQTKLKIFDVYGISRLTDCRSWEFKVML